MFHHGSCYQIASMLCSVTPPILTFNVLQSFSSMHSNIVELSLFFCFLVVSFCGSWDVWWWTVSLLGLQLWFITLLLSELYQANILCGMVSLIRSTNLIFSAFFPLSLCKLSIFLSIYLTWRKGKVITPPLHSKLFSRCYNRWTQAQYLFHKDKAVYWLQVMMAILPLVSGIASLKMLVARKHMGECYWFMSFLWAFHAIDWPCGNIMLY